MFIRGSRVTEEVRRFFTSVCLFNLMTEFYQFLEGEWVGGSLTQFTQNIFFLSCWCVKYQILEIPLINTKSLENMKLLMNLFFLPRRCLIFLQMSYLVFNFYEFLLYFLIRTTSGFTMSKQYNFFCCLSFGKYYLLWNTNWRTKKNV